MRLRWWLICSVIAMSLCFYMSRSDWPLLPILIGGVLLWPNSKYQVLFLTGLASFVMRLSLSIGYPDILVTGPLPGVPLGQAVLTCLILVVEAFIITVGVRFLARKPRSNSYLTVVIVSIVMTGIALLTASVLSIPNLGIWAIRVFVWLGPSALLTLAMLSKTERPFVSVAASVCQGWTMGIKHPFGALGSWEVRESNTPADLILIQKKGLRLLFQTAVVVLIKRSIFNVFLFGETTRSLTPNMELLLRLQAGVPLSVASAWSYVLLDHFNFFFRAWVWGAMAVGTMRLAGFDLLRHTWHPFRAHSMIDLFQRLLFYFNEVLLRIAFWPVFAALPLKNKKVRIFVALMCSVGLYNALLATGNEWFRGLRDPSEILMKNGTQFLSYLTYSTLLSLALYPSICRRLFGGDEVAHSGHLRLLRVVGFILFWAAIRVFEYAVPGDYFLNWRLFAALFGLSV